MKLHTARHNWATLALQAGKSVRWGPTRLATLTLRVYAHELREEETDLSFADFVAGPDSRRLQRFRPTTTPTR